MNSPLIAFSDCVTSIVASAASMLCAIRVGPNRHITGLICQADAIVTTDQALPALDSYTIVLPNRAMAAARQGMRAPVANLASLHLDTPVAVTVPPVATPNVGGIALVLGADIDGSPTVRLTVIHRLMRTPDGIAAILDLPGDAANQGGPVLDASGRLLGLAAIGPNSEAMVIPAQALNQVMTPNHAGAAKAQVIASTIVAPSYGGRRGWLGVALQPITIPDQLVTRAGQNSGRMVVSMTTGGPADKAGLKVGDVVLAVNATSMSGANSLRSFLEADKIGTDVELRFMRDNTIMVTQLTVAVQPG